MKLSLAGVAALGTCGLAVSPVSAQSGGDVTIATVKARGAKINDFAECIDTECLPDGLEIEVGERGFHHSGGERQRVAIGRALLARPELLLLDAPTSQLGPINERELTGVLREISRSRALPVVPHRMPTVRAADMIVVLDDGRVSSVGTHGKLLTESPLYRWLTTSHLTQVAGDGGVAAP